MKKNWKTSVLASLLAVNMVWGCACSATETTKKGKSKEKDEDKKAEYVVNKLGKNQTAEEIPEGMTVEADEDMDISFCYPNDVYLDYSSDDGYVLDYSGEEEGTHQIRINKLEEDADEPEALFKSIKKSVDKEFEKTKASDIEETKVSKRTLYMQTLKGSDVVIDAYVEIYKDFTMVYLAIGEESGELEAELNSILQTLYFSAEAYDGIEPPEPPVSNTSYLESSEFNIAITVPSDGAPDPNCPAGIYVSYPEGNIGAIFLNSDPIGSCVYDAEDLLNSFMMYGGMMASLVLVTSAEVENYYDSSFNGIPEIDAEYSCIVNDAFGTGYARIINGPDIGCYLVFYTIYDKDHTERQEEFAKAIETFEINGAPQQRTFQVHETPCGMRFVVPADLFNSIEDDADTDTTYIVIDQDHFVMTGPDTDKQQGLDGYINDVIANFDQAENHVYQHITYDDSRYQSRLIKGQFDYQGTTWYYSYGVTILGDNKPYACMYQTTDPNTATLDDIMDYLLWSINRKPE
ncbi:MAG: hypothetical protein J5379_05340 [Clostridiales bacterium]|nr:hypothetical protein [Clostridiales bacterium]